MCMAHLYGVALYYSTSLVETYFTGRAHSRPEFLYFWVYYVGFNFPWVIVPACKFVSYSPCGIFLYGGMLILNLIVLLASSLKTITRKLRSLESVKTGLDGYQTRNGDVRTSLTNKKAEKKDQ